MCDEKNAKAKYRWVLKDSTEEKNLRGEGRREELEWIRRQLEYVTFSEKYKLNYDLKRGEIYELDWGLNVNAEFSNRHYGVVIVDSDETNPLVTVVPLKSNKFGAHPKSDINLGIIDQLNSERPTLAVVNQIRTIDKLRIYTRHAIGHNEISFTDSNIFDYIPKLSSEQMEILMRAVGSYFANNGRLY